MSAKIECSQISYGKKNPKQKQTNKQQCCDWNLKKIKTNSLKREETSLRILMSKPLLLFGRNLAECPEMQHGWDSSIISLKVAQHLRDGCPGVQWGCGCKSCSLFQRDSELPSVHKRILLPRYNVPGAGDVCLPIQTYTDCFPVENLYRRREMAHNFYINLFAIAWPLGTSVHLCSQYIDHLHS